MSPAREMGDALGAVAYSSTFELPPLTRPAEARVPFRVSPNLEHCEYLPVLDGKGDPYPRPPHRHVQPKAYCDYGNRLDFWRVLEVLGRIRRRMGIWAVPSGGVVGGYRRQLGTRSSG